MNPNDRTAACQRLAADKQRLGLPLEDVRRIDTYLDEKWGITMPVPPQQWEDRLTELAGQTLAAEYWRLHDELASCYEADSPVPVKLETAFYNTLADHRISGHVHSQKRTEILDAGCLLLHLIRELGIAGPILDIGCHTGHHAHLLAHETTAEVRGIDLCPKAIEAAHANTAGTPRLAFSVGSLTQQSLAEGYELVYAVRSIDLDKTSARKIAAALKPGGIAAIFTSDAPDTSQRARKAIREARLGRGFCDVVGGWVGAERGYDSGSVLVLIKDGTLGIPADCVEQAMNVWNDHFKDYANSPDTPWHEKTQSYFRGHSLTAKSI
jgi:SAM-dependent methyltransferase